MTERVPAATVRAFPAPWGATDIFLAMALKLTDIHKDRSGGDRVAARTLDYDRRYGGAARGGEDERKSDYRGFENTYYDLVTDFFEYGWGQSFHFAPRAAQESFAASIARHEHYIAHRLGLGPGMTAVDLGCGVGGPLIEITRFSGARIVGVTDNAMHLERAAKRPEPAVGEGFKPSPTVPPPGPESGTSVRRSTPGSVPRKNSNRDATRHRRALTLSRPAAIRMSAHLRKGTADASPLRQPSVRQRLQATPVARPSRHHL